MSERKRWTGEEVETIRRLRAERRTWVEVGAAIGVARQTAAYFAKRTGMTAEIAPLPSINTTAPMFDILDKSRLPLPSGHAITWGAITAGTLLDGVEYPIR